MELDLLFLNGAANNIINIQQIVDCSAVEKLLVVRQIKPIAPLPWISFGHFTEEFRRHEIPSSFLSNCALRAARLFLGGGRSFGHEFFPRNLRRSLNIDLNIRKREV
jgi:hypothetical protein